MAIRRDVGSRARESLRRCLVAATVLAGGAAFPAGLAAAERRLGPTPRPPERPVSATASGPRAAFDIPAGDLAPALTRWSDISRIQVLAPTEEMRGLRSDGLAGAYAPDGALTALLAGTGLTYRYADTETVTIIDPQYAQLADASDAGGTVRLEELSVTGRNTGLPPPTGTIGQPPPAYAGGQVASGGRLGVLGNRSIFDTPFTQSNYTEELLRNQQAQTLTDVFANDPAVREQQPPFGNPANVYIRGFDVNARDFAFDGLYGLLSTVKPAIEGVERVEILRGPGALLYGFPPSGTVGGVVNLIPKRATDLPLNRFTAQYLSDANIGGTFDVGRRFGDGNALGVRLNGTYRDGPTPLDHQTQRIANLSIGMDYRGDAFRASLDLGYQRTDYVAETMSLGVLPGFAIPRAPRLTNNIQQPWERAAIDLGFGVLRAEYDFAPNVTAFGAVGGSINERKFFASTPTLVDGLGTISQQVYNFEVENRQWTAEIGLRGRFETGFVRHQASVSLNRYAATEPFIYGFGHTYATNIYAPVLVPRPAKPATPPGGRNDTALDGLSVTDTLSVLDDRVQVIAGGRFLNLRQQFVDPSAPAQSYPRQSAATPLAALLVKPLEPLSLYVSYAEGFGFGPTAPLEAVNPGTVLPPTRTKQIETGAKLNLGYVGLGLAFYEIEQPFAFLDPVTRIFSPSGRQGNRGIDVTIFGEPRPGYRILGGLTLLDGRLVNPADPLVDGKVAPGVPEVQVNLGSEIDVPPWIFSGLTLTGRVIHTSAQYYDQLNTQKIPDWTRLDLGVRYRFVAGGAPLVARFNVENAAGVRYWGSTGEGLLTYGRPQTFRLSLSVEL